MAVSAHGDGWRDVPLFLLHGAYLI